MVAIVFLAIAVLEIVAGANLFGGKGWARVVGFIFGGIGVLFGLIGVVGSFLPQPGTFDANSGTFAAATGPNAVGIVFNLIGLAAHAFVIWALATAGPFFDRR